MTPWLLALSLSTAAEPSVTSLQTEWQRYVSAYVEDGRVIDRTRESITTSEGQAYALLRAVWADDPTTFDLLERWTQKRLRGCRRLPAWKWGDRGKRWGVLDRQPAADADLLIAYALLLADQRWERPAFTRRARTLLRHVWTQEVVRAGDRWVLLPGPWAALDTPLRVNPSYFLPFVYRAAAVVDAEHPWMELLDDTYTLLTELHETGLAPDWVWLDPATGKVVSHGEASPYGWEAIRLPWMLEAETRWHREPRAEVLARAYTALGERFVSEGMLPAVLPAGEVDYESRALYGAVVATWDREHPVAAALAWERIASLSPQEQGSDYYANNWVWFGGALVTGLAIPWDHCRHPGETCEHLESS